MDSKEAIKKNTQKMHLLAPYKKHEVHICEREKMIEDIFI